jgi:hypothetical protein
MLTAGLFPRPWVQVLLLCFLSLATGCQYDPHAHLYTTERPRESDVVGLYVLKTHQAVSVGVPTLPSGAARVELRSDGTFVATKVPQEGVEGPGPDFFSTLRSGSGTWSLDRIGSVDNGWSMKPTWGIRLDSTTAKLMAPGLMGKTSPYGLIFTLGDPDGGDAMILERNPAS